MDVPENFELVADYATFRPAGVLKLEVLVDMVADAISYARETNVPRLLVVLTGVTGISPPRLTVRYRLVRAWARASAGRVRVGVVTTARMIDPGRFGVIVATNAGMDANVFEGEQEALEWLLG